MLFRRMSSENNHFVSHALLHLKCSHIAKYSANECHLSPSSSLSFVCGSSLHLSLFPSPPLCLHCYRSSVTWRLQWQTAPAEEGTRPTGRPPTAADALRPCRPAPQTMTARPTSSSTTCPRTWPRRSSAACSAASARSSPASWFATRSQVLGGDLGFLKMVEVTRAGKQKPKTSVCRRHKRAVCVEHGTTNKMLHVYTGPPAPSSFQTMRALERSQTRFVVFHVKKFIFDLCVCVCSSAQ